MTASIESAAAALVRHIRAPKGAVNALVNRDGDGQFICVLIDPLYWNSIYGIPSTYDGFRVLVEKREPTLALAP